MTDCDGAAECDPGGNRTPCIIPRWRRKVVRRIIRIRPGTVNDRWIVVRHIHLGGRRRLDDDVLGRRLSFLCLATASLRRGRALDRDGLLLGRLQLAVGLRASTQSLDRVHKLRLLRQHGVAELLRPVELVGHHGEHVRDLGERLHAVVPALLGERSRQCFALEAVVRLRPAVGLHHLEWIGRCDQDLRKERIGIERDRRHQLVELRRLEQRLARCRGRRLRERTERKQAEQRSHDQSRQCAHHGHLLVHPSQHSGAMTPVVNHAKPC